MTKPAEFSRREFLQATGVTTLGAIATPFDCLVKSFAKPESMPIRPFGNTGLKVPVLALGGSLHLPPAMLQIAFKWGVTYWDTAHSYMGGNSEKRIGEYFLQFPENRKKIFLVSKTNAWTINGMTKDLNQSLERMKTDYIDLFFVHGVRNASELDGSKKAWAQKAKGEGKIRLFGFSSHTNMAECMLQASKLGWIDGIMMSYNYRLMHTDRMKRAVDACAKSGIGLTAMKTQGGGSLKTGTAAELKLTDRFLSKGFTVAQAKLKAVWENPNIASICSEMPNREILTANVAAALNRTRLATSDMELLSRHARETRSNYCTGCAHICEATAEGNIPISDIMRCLMYWRSYGDRSRAAAYFNTIPEEQRAKISNADLAQAEQLCPQQMPVGKLIREAIKEFSPLQVM